MVSENPPPPKRVPPRTYTPLPAPRSSPQKPYRLAVRLIGIPAAALIGVFIYSGLRDRLFLPECDSANARQTLSEILKQLNLEPVRYEPLNTVSSSKDQNVCSAVLPLPDGANVTVDYTFYWQGNKATMKYSVSRKSS